MSKFKTISILTIILLTLAILISCDTNIQPEISGDDQIITNRENEEYKVEAKEIYEEGTHAMINGNYEENNVENESKEDGDLIIQIIFSALGRLEVTYHVRLFSDGKIITSFGTRDYTDWDITNLDFTLVYTEIEKEAFLSEEQLSELINLIDQISVDDNMEKIDVLGPVGLIDIIYDGNIFRYLFSDYVFAFPFNEDFYRYTFDNGIFIRLYREYLESTPYEESGSRLTFREFLSGFNIPSSYCDVYISVHMMRIIDKFLEYSPIEIESSRRGWGGVRCELLASLSGLAD